MKITKWLLIAVLVIASGCAVYATRDLDETFGESDVSNRAALNQTVTEADFYQNQVKPILDNRCVNCHACYDAPCQIKLTAPAGIERGGSKLKVYEGTRLLAASPTRLFEDADTTEEWRQKGFYPILNEREQSPAANLQGSVLYRAIALRKAQGEFNSQVLPANQYDFSLNRDEQCPAVEEYGDFSTAHASWGMPYGLPELTTQEYNILTSWLAKGAPMGAPSNVPDKIVSEIAKWEKRLNQDSLKARMVNRYIYEHIYLYSLYFDEEAKYAFRLVRSSTPPGEPIKRIVTRRPYDEPGVERVYYRLWLDPESRVQKTFIPMRMDEARYQRWHKWFYETDYTVEKLASYQRETASNPFKAFAPIPANSRYRFLLDHAQNTIMSFIKGPVCRGQVAVNVINEQFWVFFTNPDLELHNIGSQFLIDNASALELPASQSSNALPVSSWISYADKQKQYLSAKAKLYKEAVAQGNSLDAHAVWSGDGVNQNAALTVFRHFDNASVEKGLVGPAPKTAWIIDYPLLERIHYLLVAGFDVYGNVGHQLITRLYMDFLRMEGEMNFLMLIPKDERSKIRNYWYRDANDTIKDYIFSDLIKADVDSDIQYKTTDYKGELYGILADRLDSVLVHKHAIDQADLHKSTKESLKSIQRLQGRSVAHFPDLALLLVERNGESQALMSIVHNRAHLNISSLLDEEAFLVPEEDTLVITNGVVGDHPNVLLKVREEDIPAFADAISRLSSEADYGNLLAQYGVRRTDPMFWQVSDEIARVNKTLEPKASGILDYNRLENR